MASAPKVGDMATAEAAASPEPSPGQLVLLRALVALRVAALVPPAVLLAVRRGELARPAVAVVVLLLMVAATGAAAVVLARRPRLLLDPRVLGCDLVLAGVILAADGWVLGAESVFDAPALGAVWPLAPVMSIGLAAGPAVGAAAGAACALARLVGAAAPDVAANPLDDLIGSIGPGPARLVPTVSLVALYLTAGAGAAYIGRLQRRAEAQIASARAREEVARALHDGVMQTLAIIQRRSPDPDLARLARDTDRDLRAFLDARDSVDGGRSPTRVAEAVRAAAMAAAARFDLDPQILIDDPDDRLDAVQPDTVAAIAGAVQEALNNVAKHAGTRRAVVYAGIDETTDRVLVSVKDDGVGFDPATLRVGRGLARSIRARLEEVGGDAEIRSTPGSGTEVRLWLP